MAYRERRLELETSTEVYKKYNKLFNIAQ